MLKLSVYVHTSPVMLKEPQEETLPSSTTIKWYSVFANSPLIEHSYI